MSAKFDEVWTKIQREMNKDEQLWQRDIVVAEVAEHRDSPVFYSNRRDAFHNALKLLSGKDRSIVYEATIPAGAFQKLESIYSRLADAAALDSPRQAAS